MTEQISNIPTQDVFERVIARPVAAPALHHHRLVHVSWVAPQQGHRLVQVYTNGQFATRSTSVTQREAWLMLDGAIHQQIELLAVAPQSVAIDYSGVLEAQALTAPAVSFAVMRDYAQPLAAVLSVEVDRMGDPDRIALFEPGDARGGFGAVFGQGGFGFDASVGPGLGLGELGYGPLGLDGRALRWRHDQLDPGEHTIDLTLGSPGGASTQVLASLDRFTSRLAEAPADFTLQPDLTLTWT